MIAIEFTKMHGLGNDFIVIDASEKPFELTTKQIQKISHRQFGIGFDQLLVVEQSDCQDVDFRYRIFNADGSEVEHCGNGARCFARYVYEKGLTNKKELLVQIKKGIIQLNLHKDLTVSVNMGTPMTDLQMIPFALDQNIVQPNYSIDFSGEEITLSVASMGNPHAVIFTENLDQLKIENQAKKIQQSKYFPESVNVNYAEIISRNQIKLRTYERGAGETLACGTGACATMFCAYQLGLIENQVNITTKGGVVNIAYENEQIIMRGPAEFVFSGSIVLENFEK